MYYQRITVFHCADVINDDIIALIFLLMPFQVIML